MMAPELSVLAIILQLAILSSSCGILAFAIWTRLGRASRVEVVKPIPMAMEIML
jgi:hypothetical protein